MGQYNVLVSFFLHLLLIFILDYTLKPAIGNVIELGKHSNLKLTLIKTVICK